MGAVFNVLHLKRIMVVVVMQRFHVMDKENQWRSKQRLSLLKFVAVIFWCTKRGRTFLPRRLTRITQIVIKDCPNIQIETSGNHLAKTYN